MPTIIQPHTAYMNEGSTGVFEVSFTDEDDAATIPAAITWTLQNEDAVTINSREDVSVGSPAADIEIELTGDDLALPTKVVTKRLLLVEATYTSNAGAGRAIRDHCEFYIKPVGA